MAAPPAAAAPLPAPLDWRAVPHCRAHRATPPGWPALHARTVPLAGGTVALAGGTVALDVAAGEDHVEDVHEAHVEDEVDVEAHVEDVYQVEVDEVDEVDEVEVDEDEDHVEDHVDVAARAAVPAALGGGRTMRSRWALR